MPDYVAIFEYLPIIFAIIFVQSKMQILINPYYKLLRKEKMMLNANIIGVLIAILLITPLYMLTKSITMVALGTLLAMMIRLYLSEKYLKKEQAIQCNNMRIEILYLLIFIVCGYFKNLLLGFTVYSLFFLIFLFKQLKDIRVFIQYLRKE